MVVREGFPEGVKGMGERIPRGGQEEVKPGHTGHKGSGLLL